MSEINVEESIQAKGLTSPRITPGHIKAMHGRVNYVFYVVGTSTFCHAFLDTSFYLATGHSACVSPENFDQDIGEEVAGKKARAIATDKLYELEGYRLWQEIK